MVKELLDKSSKKWKSVVLPSHWGAIEQGVSQSFFDAGSRFFHNDYLISNVHCSTIHQVNKRVVCGHLDLAARFFDDHIGESVVCESVFDSRASRWTIFVRPIVLMN